jgi:DNA processing protein
MLGVGRLGPLGRAETETGGGAPLRSAPDAEERDAWVVLAAVEGVGPVSFGRLVARFGSAREVLAEASASGAVRRLVAATGDEDGRPTLAPDAAAALVAAAAAPDRLLEPIRRAGLCVVTLVDDGYPPRLRRIELPPPVLFVRGDPAALDRAHAVAVVGTRRPTEVGRATAGRIGDAIAALGATVVSGLALGIDGAAHAAAVRAGTPTVAVIGGGHERLYPAAHRSLARAIADGGGAVVSEFPPETHPTRGTFPRRNRLISGLADATVVVEAGARSGALTTAAWALEQGRGLYIVPGRLDDPSVAGSLAFLREAGPEAHVVAGIPELLEDLQLAAAFDRRPGVTAVPALAALTPVERALAGLLADGRGTVDELVAASGQLSATVLGALTSLEMRGLVVEAFGRYRATGPLAGRTARRRATIPEVGGRRRRSAA